MSAYFVFLQLPDYHELIEHPMDFSTIREKLLNDSYSILEEFEVCCVCSLLPIVLFFGFVSLSCVIGSHLILAVLFCVVLLSLVLSSLISCIMN